MNRRLIFEALIAGALLWIWWRLPSPPPTGPYQRAYARSQTEPVATQVETVQRGEDSPATSSEAATNSITASSPLIGELILRDYASPSNSPEHDLALMGQLMQNFTLIVKSAATRPLSANEDWARALRGFNPAHQRFLPDQHIALNSQGQLVDRWGSPLFFHALGYREFQVRSAGPDRRLWTTDDIQRNADGSILYGASMQPPKPVQTAVHP